MANYAIGDIQGCYDPLARLLEKVNFDTSQDTLFCVGDLVNRGPDSLKVIECIQSLNDRCVCVLGNHDIHLLAMLYGLREHRASDTLLEVLNDSQANDIAGWLRQQPLMVNNSEDGYLMVHAGIYPWWSIEQAEQSARDVEACFQDEKRCIKLLKKIYSNNPSKWEDDLSNIKQRRFTINAFTRMRYVNPNGHMDFSESGFNGKHSNNRVPWFDIPNPATQHLKVIFGHWSALGLYNTPHHLCLDTGYVWGRHMTMIKIPTANCEQELEFTIAPYTQEVKSRCQFQK